MTDLIDRKEAVDAVNAYLELSTVSRTIQNMTSVQEILEKFPTAQPYTEAEIQKMQELEQAELEKAFELGKAEALSEIVLCKDCKYGSPNEVYGCRLERFSCQDKSIRLYADDYCSMGERKIDE